MQLALAIIEPLYFNQIKLVIVNAELLLDKHELTLYSLTELDSHLDALLFSIFIILVGDKVCLWINIEHGNVLNNQL